VILVVLPVINGKKISHLTPTIHLSRFFHLLDILQNTENVGNVALYEGVPADKSFPPDSDQLLCPWTLPGAPPPDPHYRFTLSARHGELSFTSYYYFSDFRPVSLPCSSVT